MAIAATRGVHHVGIVVRRLADAYRFYRDTLGLPLLREAEIPDQGVRVALLSAGESEIELLEPLGTATGVARFLERRGEGLHHLCFDTVDVAAALAGLRAHGVELIDQAPRPGLAGQIAFLHPRASGGVLVELATPPADAPARLPASPLGLKRVVIGARDPRTLAATFSSLFGLGEVAVNGGPRAMLAAGRATLLVVPAEEVGGSEGLVALSLLAVDFEGLTRALDRAGLKRRQGAGELTVEPTASHGVHLHISRFP